MPFPCGGYCVYASVFSSRGKLYTQFNRHFAEFDPAKRAFTFCAKGGGRIGSALTEDDNGVIWAISYPASELVSFNPRTRELKDYGAVHQESWDQYPSCILRRWRYRVPGGRFRPPVRRGQAGAPARRAPPGIGLCLSRPGRESLWDAPPRGGARVV
jgi:hypothetical protein